MEIGFYSNRVWRLRRYSSTRWRIDKENFSHNSARETATRFVAFLGGVDNKIGSNLDNKKIIATQTHTYANTIKAI